MTMACDAAHEARDLIDQIGRRFPAGTPIKTIQSHVANAARLSSRRVRAFWNNEVRRPHDDEMKALRRAAAARRAEEAASHDLDEFRARLDRLEALMGTIDPDFYQPHADALRDASRGRE